MPPPDRSIDPADLERLGLAEAESLEARLPAGVFFAVMLIGEECDDAGNQPIAFGTNGRRDQLERLLLEALAIVRRAPEETFPKSGASPSPPGS